MVISDETLTNVIRWYAREAGVRGLERALATILRKCARCIIEGASTPIDVEPSHVPWRAMLLPSRANAAAG